MWLSKAANTSHITPAATEQCPKSETSVQTTSFTQKKYKQFDNFYPADNSDQYLITFRKWFWTFLIIDVAVSPLHHFVNFLILSLSLRLNNHTNNTRP